MIKEIRFVRRNAQISREEFERYWIEEHAPLVSRSLPRLRRYVVNVVTSDSDDSDIGGVVEMVWDNIDDMRAAYASDLWNAPERVASTNYFSDQSARSAPADPSKLQFDEHDIPVEPSSTTGT